MVYRKGQAVYRQALKNLAAKNRERAAFARVLGNLIASGKSVVYTDETTYTAWLFKTKSWACSERPVFLAKNDKKFGTTVYGAIGDCVKKGVRVKLGDSTNKREFLTFLSEVRDSLKKRAGKPVLVYDGHSAHRSPEV